MAILILSSLNCNAQIIVFPDLNFENALVNFEVVDTTGNGLGDSVCDTNGDGLIQLSEAEAVTGLIISYHDIQSLEGIEYFTNLETLKSRGNFLQNLVLSQNTQLKWLHVETNPLTEMDLSQNFLMERLWIYQNQLSYVDVSHLPNLQSLRVYSNQLVSLNIANGNNEFLTDFQAYNNPNLSCIQVDDITFAENNPNWIKDETAHYNESCLLASDEFDLKNKVFLTPNPVTNDLHIVGAIPIESVRFYEVSGKMIFHLSNPDLEIDLQSLSAGLYFVEIKTSEGRLMKQLLKN